MPTWLALTLGAVLLIGDGVVGTLRELREPTADLVVDPRVVRDRGPTRIADGARRSGRDPDGLDRAAFAVVGSACSMIARARRCSCERSEALPAGFDANVSR